MFKALLSVWHKELTDVLRDKRSLRLAFLPPLYFAAIFVAGVFFALKLQSDNRVDGTTQIPVMVQGGEYLPELVDWLMEQGAVIESVTDDAYSRVEKGEAQFALIIPPEVVEQRIRGKALTLWLVYDASNQKVHARLHFVRGQVQAWSQRTGSLNLLARGIAPEVGITLQLRESNVADDQKMSIFLLGSLPMILVLSAFVASIGFSADMTAGERERRSLEALLITPASSLAIILGKWLTSLSLTLAVMLITILLLWLALIFLPFSELGLRVYVGADTILLILLALMPLMLLAVALQLAIAIFARSFKDAQTYVGLIMLIPMVPGFYILFNPGVYADWFTWVPLLGQQVVIRDLLVGGDLPPQAMLHFWLPGLGLTMLFLLFAARQLRRSRIVYG